jgi:FkbM family methyltransferase
MDKNKIKNLFREKACDNEDLIILDVGSFDGEDSREFLNLFPSAKIYAFEADPMSLRYFEGKNHPKEITLIKAAVSNIDGEIDWYSSLLHTKYPGIQWSLSSSLRKPTNHLKRWPGVSFSPTTFKVNSIKLDTWVSQNLKNNIVDFIWCDVNGAEEDFILGGLDTLQNKTRYLYTEFFNEEMWQGQVNLDWITDHLSNFEIIETHKKNNVLLKNKTI